MLDPWPFADPPNVAVFTSRRIVFGDVWIHYVSHDEDTAPGNSIPWGSPPKRTPPWSASEPWFGTTEPSSSSPTSRLAGLRLGKGLERGGFGGGGIDELRQWQSMVSHPTSHSLGSGCCGARRVDFPEGRVVVL